MGAKRKTNGQVQFYQIFNGKIIKRVKEKTEHSKTLKTHSGKEFEAEIYDSLEGKIQKYYVFTENYEDVETEKICIQLIDDNGEIMCLTERMTSDCASSLIQRLSAVDLSENVEIVAMLKDKEYNYAFLKQHGNTVKSPFTENNPLPRWNEVIVNGKKVWDKTDCINALKEQVKKVNVLLALLTNKANGNSENLQTAENDDLPF